MVLFKPFLPFLSVVVGHYLYKFKNFIVIHFNDGMVYNIRKSLITFLHVDIIEFSYFSQNTYNNIRLCLRFFLEFSSCCLVLPLGNLQNL